MGKQTNHKKAKVNATRVLCGILAGLMLAGSIAAIIVALIWFIRFKIKGSKRIESFAPLYFVFLKKW